MRIAECGLLIQNLPPGTAGCEAVIEIFFNPQSAIRIPQSSILYSVWNYESFRDWFRRA
jgi:hypothetical protein